MPDKVNRGFVPQDKIEFSSAAQEILRRAQMEIRYLLDRGYEIEKIISFVGNHYQFSARQRMALTRATCSHKAGEERNRRLFSHPLDGQTVYIDGFNAVITLETALSEDTTLLLCMDGTIRDLCGLHGTYRIIDKTLPALKLLCGKLEEEGAGRAVFYLDSPVSNSGRLAQEIRALNGEYPFEIETDLVANADAMLWGKPLCVTSDAIILDRCISFINPVRDIIETKMPGRALVCLDAEEL